MPFSYNGVLTRNTTPLYGKGIKEQRIKSMETNGKLSQKSKKISTSLRTGMRRRMTKAQAQTVYLLLVCGKRI